MQFVSEQVYQIDPAFCHKVKQMADTPLDRCYQCLTCSLSCPAAFAMDYLPNQIIRMVQLGLKKQVLTSSTIWLCATCETCVARCPNEVDVLKVMDALREMALKEGEESKEKVITTFNQTFLQGVRLLGRDYELGMLLVLKLKTRDLFTDLVLGIKMLLKGKLKLLPTRIKGSDEIKAIFEKTRGEV